MYELALIVWVLLVAAHVIRLGRDGVPSVGLPLAYVLGLTMVIWFGALIHALPWHVTMLTEAVQEGFVIAAVGFVGFSIGTLALGRFIARRMGAKPGPPPEEAAMPDERLPLYCMLFGGVLVGVVFPLFGDLPTLTALSFTGAYLVIWGICLDQWRQRQEGKPTDWLKIALIAICLPMLTIIVMENVIRAAIVVLTIVAFVIGSYRRRLPVLLAGVVVVYIGLSVGIGYLSARAEIRSQVHSGSMFDKIDRVVEQLSTVEPFDIRNDNHLDLIDMRMNQSFLIGAAYNHISTGWIDYAYGETVLAALLAVIPRALWPDKPMVAGSMNNVATYTGMEFAEGTSVGLGPVMELYINFGVIGTFVGMLVIGTVLRLLDAATAHRLNKNDWLGASVPFVVGVAMMAVEGSFVEVTASAAGAFIIATVAIKVWDVLDVSQAGEARGALSSVRIRRPRLDGAKSVES